MLKLITPLTLLVLLTACGTVEQNAYRVIGSTQGSVTAARRVWAEDVVLRRVPFTQQIEVRTAYKQYQSAMLVASNSIFIYKATGDKNQLTGALQSLSYISAQVLLSFQPTPVTNPPMPSVWEKLP